MTPIFILSGPAGSGKDTVAGLLVKHVARNGITIAQADAMKRFARNVFYFTDDQLWGPSSSRNAADPRFDLSDGKSQREFSYVSERLDKFAESWLKSIGLNYRENFGKLENWFRSLFRAHIDEGKPLTPRMVLQTLGTEFGRKLDQNIWSRLAIQTAEKLLIGGYTYTPSNGLCVDPEAPGYDFVVITDGRFRNELLNVSKIGGRAIKIQPTGDTAQYSEAVDKAGVKGHASEAELGGIPDSWYDYIFVNDKSKGLTFLKTWIHQLAVALGIHKGAGYHEDSY